MNKVRKENIARNQISKIVTYRLGGYDQKVLIEGKTKDLPIVLCLHGGPGTPIPFSVGARGLFPSFTEKYLMVYWDQLGCGINNYKLDERFTIQTFVDMTVDLIQALKKEYPKNSLYIFGVSWGSVLAAKACSQAQELVDGVVVYGQVLKELSYNEEVFEAIMTSKAPEKVKSELQQIRKSKERTFENTKKITRWIQRYTQGYQNKSGETNSVFQMVSGLLSSPDYCLKDKVAMIKNGYRNLISLQLELLNLDLSGTFETIQKPYYIIQGDTDIVTSTKAISNYVREIDHKNLQCTIVKNSAHLPSKEGMKLILTQLAELSGSKES